MFSPSPLKSMFDLFWGFWAPSRFLWSSHSSPALGPLTSRLTLWSGVLDQIKSNQFYLSSVAWGVVAQSPEPVAHVLNARAFRIELEFRNVGFCGEGKTGVPGEKPLGAEKRTNNKFNPHMTSGPGIEPGPHWWKASAHTTAPFLLPEIERR